MICLVLAVLGDTLGRSLRGFFGAILSGVVIDELVVVGTPFGKAAPEIPYRVDRPSHALFGSSQGADEIMSDFFTVGESHGGGAADEDECTFSHRMSSRK